MRKKLLWLGITAAAGATAGMLLDKKDRPQGAIAGAVVGALAGSIAARIYRHVAEDDGIGYYTSSSPLYENPEDMDYL